MSQRPYAQLCALATALDVVGDRWAFLVIRELLGGPRRFTDLLDGLPGAGTNTLATRLKELEADGVVARRWLPPPAAATVYELTARGRQLEPVLLGLTRWGAPLIGRIPVEHPIRAGWIGVAMGAFFRPANVPNGSFELGMPTGTIVATITEGRLTVADGPAVAPIARVTGSEDTVLGLLRRQVSTADAVRTGALTVEGDLDAFARLVEACAIGGP